MLADAEAAKKRAPGEKKKHYLNQNNTEYSAHGNWCVKRREQRRASLGETTWLECDGPAPKTRRDVTRRNQAKPNQTNSGSNSSQHRHCSAGQCPGHISARPKKTPSDRSSGAMGGPMSCRPARPWRPIKLWKSNSIASLSG